MSISFCVITHNDHLPQLARMIDSLPTGVEVCVVMTAKGTEDKFEIGDTTTENGRTFRNGLWTHTKHFDFSRARNYSIDLATNDWIFWIDSDDVLLREQHADILDMVNLPAGVGGVRMGCVGSHAPAERDSNDNEYMAVPQVRAFRKSTGVRFKGMVHEQILPQLVESRFAIIHSHILIAHMGYAEMDWSEYRRKVQRNLNLLEIQIATDTFQREYYEECLLRGLLLNKQMKGN